MSGPVISRSTPGDSRKELKAMREPSRKAIRRSSILLVLAVLAVSLPALVQSGAGATGPAIKAVPAVIGIADAETINLCADEGTIDLPGVADVPIWGFSLDAGTGCGPATLPGPVLSVDVGDVVTVNLQNNLSEELSIVFPGQDLVPNAVVVSPGGSDSYTFTTSDPGTFLYEAGTNTSVQVAMGLYGALVVRPLAAGQAYDPTTAYDVEQVLVLSEIDANLNGTPDPNDFDFVGDPTVYTDGYHPTYFLINGEAYPDTDPIAATTGESVLLRYVNAGLSHHTMTLLGKHQRVIAKDAFPTAATAYDAVAETVPAGSTLDALVTLTGVAGGTTLSLYNRQLDVTNDGAYPGGMLTFLNVS